MIEAIVIKKYLDSEVLHIPVSKDMIGKDAEIIILTESHQRSEIKMKSKRKPGSAKGIITIADDFELPLDDEMLKDLFYVSNQIVLKKSDF